jgi:hypothetical protein
MDNEPKVGGTKKKSPPEKAKGKKQLDRFIETAREIGADESGKNFEQAVTIIFSRYSKTED